MIALDVNNLNDPVPDVTIIAESADLGKPQRIPTAKKARAKRKTQEHALEAAAHKQNYSYVVGLMSRVVKIN